MTFFGGKELVNGSILPSLDTNGRHGGEASVDDGDDGGDSVKDGGGRKKGL